MYWGIGLPRRHRAALMPRLLPGSCGEVASPGAMLTQLPLLGYSRGLQWGCEREGKEADIFPLCSFLSWPAGQGEHVTGRST